MSRDEHLAFHRLIAAIRTSHNAADMMDEAFANLLGVNRTDGRCLDIVQRLGQITAGELAQHSGLTTGAVTAVIDRLEKAGYLRRIRDTLDRRKVFVELTDLANKFGEIVYAQIGEIGDGGINSMPIEDIELVARFLRTSAQMNRSLSELLREYAGANLKDPAERLRAAKNFAARITKERTELSRQMSQAWRNPDPDDRSGKIGVRLRSDDHDK